MDIHIKKSEEEKKEDLTVNKNRKGADPTKKEKLRLLAERKDVMYGLFSNVSATNMSFTPIEFGKSKK